MIRLFLIVWTGCTALLLASCATLSREECLRGDWHQIGVQDGQRGHELTRIDRHRSACRDTPVNIDEGAYQAGRDIGLVSYCTPVSGYHVAAEGDRYSDVCPVTSEAQFLQGYILGEQVYRAEQAIADAERRVWNLESRLNGKRDEIKELRTSIAASDDRYDVSGPERTLWILRNEADDLRRDLRDAQFDVDHARRVFRDVQERTSLQVLGGG
ncbi:MAG: DUF2799 domain-containing protein [Hyphomicrobiales bacterium]|jgi:hypothetical protein